MFLIRTSVVLLLVTSSAARLCAADWRFPDRLAAFHGRLVQKLPEQSYEPPIMYFGDSVTFENPKTFANSVIPYGYVRPGIPFLVGLNERYATATVSEESRGQFSIACSKTRFAVDDFSIDERRGRRGRFHRWSKDAVAQEVVLSLTDRLSSIVARCKTDAAGHTNVSSMMSE